MAEANMIVVILFSSAGLLLAASVLLPDVQAWISVKLHKGGNGDDNSDPGSVRASDEEKGHVTMSRRAREDPTKGQVGGVPLHL